MYQNQLFFEDFEKVFKVRIAEKKANEEKKADSQEKIKATHASTTLGDIWLKRLIVKLRLQSMLH